MVVATPPGEHQILPQFARKKTDGANSFVLKDLASPSLDIYREGGDYGEVLAIQHQWPWLLNLAITSFRFNPFSLQSFSTPYFL